MNLPTRIYDLSQPAFTNGGKGTHAAIDRVEVERFGERIAEGDYEVEFDGRTPHRSAETEH